MSRREWGDNPSTTWAPRTELIRPRGRRWAWMEQGKAPATGGLRGPRERLIKKAAAEGAWNRARSETNKRLRYGDPDVAPPVLVKPASSGTYGSCPDDDALPPHKRQKRKPEET